MRYVLIVFGAIVLCQRGLFGAEPAAPPTAEEIKSLIAQLRSPNTAPKEHGGSVDYPAGFDGKAQGKVDDAFHKLRILGFAALPYLLEHVDDQHYSMTGDTGPGDFNLTVGQVCWFLVETQLWPHSRFNQISRGDNEYHDERSNPPRPDYFAHYQLRDSKSAGAWWEKRKNQSLRDLQLEVLQWTIAEEAKKPNTYSAEERQFLNDQLAKLRDSREALKSESWIWSK